MTGVKGIAARRTARLRCEQEVAGGRDVYVVPMPAVVTVKEGLNLPRYPSVPGRLRAKRKPMTRVHPGAARVPAGDGAARAAARVGQAGQVLGNGPEAAPAVVGVLSELGVL